jgi:hypothetical protein
VDSFHALLQGGHQVSAVVWVAGYDVALGNPAREAGLTRAVRSVADALGVKAVVVRTNLRAHRAYRRANWERVHGGALAAVGHLLAPSSNELLVASSYPYAFDQPWGSHWKLDPWWSSDRITMVHVGAERWRTQKLIELADEPLVRHHLRVCWQNLATDGNCGRCEKCVRTMLILDGLGILDAYAGFPPSRELPGIIDGLEPMRPHLVPVYQELLSRELGPETRRATERWIERSRRPTAPAPRPTWWRRTLG